MADQPVVQTARAVRVRRPPRLSDQVATQLLLAILSGRFAPSQPLPPETELARQCGVGRNSIREALRGLEALGVLTRRGGDARFTVSASAASMPSINELAEYTAISRPTKGRVMRKAQ